MPGQRLIAVLILGLTPGVTFACSCAPPGPPSREAALASNVFLGEVVQVRDSQPRNTWWTRLMWRLGRGPDPTTMMSTRPIAYTFRVQETFKGEARAVHVVNSAASESSCGYRFRPGERYVVYANSNRGSLYAGRCTLNGLATNPRYGLAWLRSHRSRPPRSPLGRYGELPTPPPCGSLHCPGVRSRKRPSCVCGCVHIYCGHGNRGPHPASR